MAAFEQGDVIRVPFLTLKKTRDITDQLLSFLRDRLARQLPCFGSL